LTAYRHHFVSRCYLKAFAVERKKKKYQVVVYDRKKRTTFTTAIENVGLERDFNRVDIEGVEPDAIEKGLSLFEDTLAPALERTIAGATFLSDDDRAHVLNLIGLLALRNPRWRERMRSFQEEILKRMLELSLATKERWEGQMKRAIRDGDVDANSRVTYEEMKEFHKKDEYKIVIPREEHMKHEFKGFDVVLPYLFARKWVFLKAPKGSAGFITSDHPVALIWSEPPRSNFYSPGFGLKKTEVIFPLSAKLCLAGAFEIDDGTIEATDDFVARFNGVAVAYATRQIYARDHNFRYFFPDDDGPRKAARLLGDSRFLRPARTETRNERGFVADPGD
jgi:hypothetical protein